MQSGLGFRFLSAVPALVSIAVPRFAFYVFLRLSRRRFQVIVAHTRVVEGSASLWFATGVLIDFKHYIVDYMAFIYMLFAPLCCSPRSALTGCGVCIHWGALSILAPTDRWKGSDWVSGGSREKS